MIASINSTKGHRTQMPETEKDENEQMELAFAQNSAGYIFQLNA